MGNFYVYLVSSLPALIFGAKPPFSYENFLKRCERLIPEKDIETLAAIPALAGSLCAEARNETLKKWVLFDTLLRNELVKVRAQRRGLDAAKYLRQDGCPESAYTAHIAINAYRKPSLIEAERTLDAERWHYLDELSAGHYFDLDTLVIYACKLLISEKWDRVRAADAGGLLEASLAAGVS